MATTNKCPNCGGKLKPLNRKSMVCPYCETIVDREDVEPFVSVKDSNILSNNTINYTKNVTKLVKPERKIDIPAEGWAVIALVIYGAAMIAMLVSIELASEAPRLMSLKYATNADYAAFPFSYDDVEHVPYSEVVSRLEEVGFRNVKTIASKPEGFWDQIVIDYNSTLKILAEGEEPVSGKYYHRDSQIFVYYYAKP